MNLFTRSETTLYVLLSMLVYIGLNAMLPTDLLINLLNALFFGVSCTVLLALVPLVWRAISTEQFGRVSQLSVGIFLTWVALFVGRFNSFLFRALHRPAWLLNSSLISFSAYIAILGGILYIIVPGVFAASEKSKRGALVFSIALGIILAVATFMAQYQAGPNP